MRSVFPRPDEGRDGHGRRPLPGFGDGSPARQFLATRIGRRVVIFAVVFVTLVVVVVDRLILDPFEPATPILSEERSEARRDAARDFFPLEAREDLGLIFDGRLRDVRDDTEVEDDDALYALLETVARGDAEDHEDGTDPSPGYEVLCDHPAAFRGKRIVVRILPIFAQPRRVRGPGPPVESVVRVYGTDPYGEDEGYVVDVVDDLPRSLALRKDILELHGIFLKIRSYPNERGQMKKAPFLVARRARVFDAFLGHHASRWGLWPLLAMGATVGGLAATGLVVRSRRTRARRREQQARLEALRERRGKVGSVRSEAHPRF